MDEFVKIVEMLRAGEVTELAEAPKAFSDRPRVSFSMEA